MSNRPNSVLRSARPDLTRRDTSRRAARQRDPNSLVASAALMTGASPSRAKITTEAWQNQAWQYYDLIGELRFGVTWKANALSRVNLICAIPPEVQGDEPIPVDLDTHPQFARAVELVAQIAGGVSGQGQLLAGAAKQLTVPGVGYILAKADASTDSFSTWAVLSNDECKKENDGTLSVTDAESGEWTPLSPNDILIKLWAAHPRRRHLPDSPVHGVLSSLAEIHLITQRIAADAASRLIGAGLLILPEEAEFAPGQESVTGGNEADTFTETFVKVTQIAIGDQESPAAKTPIIVKMPGEWVKDVQFLTFYSDFDVNLDPLRLAAIKRVALGLDMPPEALLGMGDSNHWSAWQIAEEAITMQIEPMAETVCHALTVGWLIPALQGESDVNNPFDPGSVMVWYDTSDLAARPDLSKQASEAHLRNTITDAAYLGYQGLDASDVLAEQDRAKAILLGIAETNPTLAPAILAYLGLIPQAVADAMMSSSAPAPGGSGPGGAPGGAPAPVPADSGPPATQDNAAGLVAAADGIVTRALEKAGLRLRSAAGKRKPGGAESVQCADPTMLHCSISATAHASLDVLLADAWDRVPEIAGRYGIDPGSLTTCLDNYTRGLLAASNQHTFARLSQALGVTDDRFVDSPI